MFGITANTLAELKEEQKMAIENIDSEARYNIVIKFTENGFELTKLGLAEELENNGDAVFPPAKKAMKTAKKTTDEKT